MLFKSNIEPNQLATIPAIVPDNAGCRFSPIKHDLVIDVLSSLLGTKGFEQKDLKIFLFEFGIGMVASFTLRDKKEYCPILGVIHSNSRRIRTRIYNGICSAKNGAVFVRSSSPAERHDSRKQIVDQIYTLVDNWEREVEICRQQFKLLQAREVSTEIIQSFLFNAARHKILTPKRAMSVESMSRRIRNPSLVDLLAACTDQLKSYPANEQLSKFESVSKSIYNLLGKK